MFLGEDWFFVGYVLTFLLALVLMSFESEAVKRFAGLLLAVVMAAFVIQFSFVVADSLRSGSVSCPTRLCGGYAQLSTEPMRYWLFVGIYGFFVAAAALTSFVLGLLALPPSPIRKKRRWRRNR